MCNFEDTVIGRSSKFGLKCLFTGQEILREHYTPSGKRKVIALYTELTSLKLQPNEEVTDYMIRAETAAASLKRAGEVVSDSLLVAMVIKGLPVEYKPFNTVITQKKEQVSFTEFKVALRSYEETVKFCEPSADDQSSSSVMFQHNVPIRSPVVKCYSCGQMGHKSNDPKCPNYKKQPKKSWCDWCKTNTHSTHQCRKKRGNHHAAKFMDDGDDHSYQFHVSVCDSNVTPPPRRYRPRPVSGTQLPGPQRRTIPTVVGRQAGGSVAIFRDGRFGGYRGAIGNTWF